MPKGLSEDPSIPLGRKKKAITGTGREGPRCEGNKKPKERNMIRCPGEQD